MSVFRTLARRLLWLALLALSVVGCGPSVSDLQAQLDRLAPPADWTMAQQVSRGSNGPLQPCSLFDAPCPNVARYYLAVGPPTDVYAEVEQTLTDAGLVLDRDAQRACSTKTGAECVVHATDGYQWMVSVYPGDAPVSVELPDHTGPVVVIAVSSK